MRFALSFVPVFFLATIVVAQSDGRAIQTSQLAGNTAQDLTAEQKVKVDHLAKLQRDFGKKMNSPGVELSLKETTRSRESDRTLISFGLNATGLPSNTTFSLFQVQMDGTTRKLMEGVTFNAKGEAICAGRQDTCQGNGPDDPIDLVVYGGKAEPARFALVSNDEEHVKAFVGVVPFPNATTDRGCRLESVLGTPNGELTYIQGTGFEPNEELTIDSQSYDEKHHATSKAAADGSYFVATLPFVSGKKSGKTVWEVKSKNCNPKLSFSWGTYHLE
jgi:hypothetical protein